MGGRWRERAVDLGRRYVQKQGGGTAAVGKGENKRGKEVVEAAK